MRRRRRRRRGRTRTRDKKLLCCWGTWLWWVTHLQGDCGEKTKLQKISAEDQYAW
jgi:hypothetical protein